MDSVLIPPLLVLMVVVVVICLPARIMRKREFMRELETVNDRINGAGVRDLTPGELAFLHRGPRQTMLAGLAEAAADRAPEPDTLAAVIKRHLDRGEARTEELEQEAEPYLRAVSDRLERLGLIVPRAVLDKHRRIGQKVRRVCYLMAAVYLVFALVVMATDQAKPMAVLVVQAAALLWILCWVPRKRMPRLHSAAAARIAERSEETYDYLSPRHRPAYASYGPEAIAVATAVFGAAVLHDAYPALTDNPLAAELMSFPRFASDAGGFSCGFYAEDGEKGCSAGCNSDGGCGSGGCGGGD